MTVYFLRHGIAEPNGVSGDSSRRLSAQGRVGVERLSKGAKFCPDLILSSPFVRAMETAKLLNEKSGWGAPLATSRALTPNSSPEELWDEVRVHQDSQILVVSHEPLLSATVSWMLGSTRVVTDFQPATLVALAIPPSSPPQAELLWMVAPAMLP